MNIYHAHGHVRDHEDELFSFVVRAETADTARQLVREVLPADSIIFHCCAVGLAYPGETDEAIIW